MQISFPSDYRTGDAGTTGVVTIADPPPDPNGFTRPDTVTGGKVSVVSTNDKNEGFWRIFVFNLIDEIFLSITAISLPANDDADAVASPIATGLSPVFVETNVEVGADDSDFPDVREKYRYTPSATTIRATIMMNVL